MQVCKEMREKGVQQMQQLCNSCNLLPVATATDATLPFRGVALLQGPKRCVAVCMQKTTDSK
jgi:hypothetical protein